MTYTEEQRDFYADRYDAYRYDGGFPPRRSAELAWEDFIHLLPFDSSTAGVLSAEYRARLALLDKEHDICRYERYSEKKALMDERKSRYSLSAFRR